MATNSASQSPVPQVALYTRLGTVIDAPVVLPDGTAAGYVPGMVAQLFLVTGGSLLALEPATSFRTGPTAAALAYINPAMVDVPGVPMYAVASFRLRVWESTKGATYEEARDHGGYYGKSEGTALAHGGPFHPAGNVLGLEGIILTRRETIVLDSANSAEIRLYLDNADGKTYTLEVSSDLVHWTSWETLHASGGEQVTLPIASGNRFFRAVLQE